MEKWIPYIATAISSLAIGYLLGYLNHGLAMRREAATRRRLFRDEIRSISLRYDAVNSTNFSKTYQQSTLDVKNACTKIVEDIKFWRRGHFLRCRDLYCSFQESDIELPRPNTPAGMQEYMKANRKKREESTAILRGTLDKIIKYAK
jgi:hypothetical protein